MTDHAKPSLLETVEDKRSLWNDYHRIATNMMAKLWNILSMYKNQVENHKNIIDTTNDTILSQKSHDLFMHPFYTNDSQLPMLEQTLHDVAKPIHNDAATTEVLRIAKLMKKTSAEIVNWQKQYRSIAQQQIDIIRRQKSVIDQHQQELDNEESLLPNDPNTGTEDDKTSTFVPLNAKKRMLGDPLDTIPSKQKCI